MKREPAIYVIDDHHSMRSLLSALTSDMSHECIAFETATHFLASCEDICGGCLVLDIGLPGMDGLQLQDELNRRGVTLPVIFLTGRADVPNAVRAMRHGAFEFLEKPADNAKIVDAIERALAYDRSVRSALRQTQTLRLRFALLTDREREVLTRLAAGHTNKATSLSLGVSERTIEAHRAKLMQKLDAQSFAHLVRMLKDLENTSA
jgi:two-component system, LuxR family, response regulator FixJ